jgi:LacI family transcriptional regulator
MKITIKAIAEKAGVSVSTVSKIINNYSEVSDETRQRVLKIMRDYDYQPAPQARSPQDKPSNLIGVLFAGKLNVDFNHLFFIDVINSFKKRIGLLGYDLLFFSNEKFQQMGGEDYLARCNYFQVDGCIIIAGEELEPCIADLDKSDIPCIGIDIELTGQRSGYIMSDNSLISKKVVEHFYLQGYKEIGFIGSTEKSLVSRLREDSFVEALSSYGLSVNRDWIVRGDDFFEESGYRAMRQMIAHGELPRAIFAASDLLAIGAMRALREIGCSIPKDIAIIGCDDIEACKYMTPALTTARQDKAKIGILAALMLFDLINNQLQSTAVLVEPELIVRESCGAVR